MGSQASNALNSSGWGDALYRAHEALAEGRLRQGACRATRPPPPAPDGTPRALLESCRAQCSIDGNVPSQIISKELLRCSLELCIA